MAAVMPADASLRVAVLSSRLVIGVIVVLPVSVRDVALEELEETINAGILDADSAEF